MTRVLLADDHILFRETLAEYLERDKELFFNIDEAGDLDTAFNHLSHMSYDLVILDWHMPGLGKIEILESLLAHFPNQKFIIVSGTVSDAVIKKINALNIFAFLPKTLSGREFLSYVKDVLAGEVITHHGPSFIQEPAHDNLTAREKEVLVYLKQGLSNKEIARDLNVSEVTVKKHVNHILQKYNCHTRTALLAQWIH